MPIYGYRCRSCAHEFEVTQRMSDPAGAACPDCGGPGTRLFFPAGILFKGSGFYKTDSRAPAPASASSSGDGAKTDKTDKKPGDGTGKSTPASPDSGSKPAKESTPASTPTPTSQPKGSSAKAASTSD
ncbi:MAG: FmdB family transcriptional regulator [Candidatus Dormibacteraeota bacterium]|uniref:FmdB family transcriptional regulator n=1 Tax=Candidatus Amunia macphersoniae TaxID=3127014 RepID=A0A934KS12_9BACT|nr:FmdB family transcriptional regulator [Candidatus Dormibacteraeota bacterium]